MAKLGSVVIMALFVFGHVNSAPMNGLFDGISDLFGNIFGGNDFVPNRFPFPNFGNMGPPGFGNMGMPPGMPPGMPGFGNMRMPPGMPGFGNMGPPGFPDANYDVVYGEDFTNKDNVTSLDKSSGSSAINEKNDIVYDKSSSSESSSSNNSGSSAQSSSSNNSGSSKASSASNDSSAMNNTVTSNETNLSNGTDSSGPDSGSLTGKTGPNDSIDYGYKYKRNRAGLGDGFIANAFVVGPGISSESVSGASILSDDVLFGSEAPSDLSSS